MLKLYKFRKTKNKEASATIYYGRYEQGRQTVHF